MKVSYYDMFDLLAEEAGQLLSQYEDQDISLEDFTADRTIRAVKSQIKEAQKVKRIRKPKLAVRLLIAAILIMLLGTIAAAAYNKTSIFEILRWGSAVVDDSNREYVGKEVHSDTRSSESSYDVHSKPDAQAYLDELEKRREEIVENSTIINRIDNLTEVPKTVNYFPVVLDGDKYTTPEIIFGNGAMIVFTKEDGSGWNLQEGESLVFETEMYPSEINLGKGQHILYGYVYNGSLVMDSQTDELSLSVSYQLKAENEGEYYICLVSSSSDPITLKEGIITHHQ